MSDKAKVLVLGAGAVQLPLIKELKERNFYVLAVSNIDDDKARNEVDEFHLISSTNFPKIKALVEEKNIINAFSIGSDVALRTLTKLAAHFSWPNHPSIDGFEALHNKAIVREKLYKAGLSKIEPNSCTEYSDDLFDFESYSEWIIKPVDGYGSKGVHLVEEYFDKEKYYKLAKVQSVEHTVIIEPFIEGKQFTTEFFVSEKGKVTFMTVIEKKNNEAFVPYLYLLQGISSYKKFVSQIALALELEQGYYNIDFVEGDDGFELMDIAPRLGGNNLALLYQMAFEKNSVSDYVRFVLEGSPLEERKPTQQIGLYLLHHASGGVVTSIDEQVSFLNVLTKQYWVNVGDDVPAFTQGSFQQGYIVFEAEKKQTIDQLDELFLENEVIKVKEPLLN